MFQKATRLKLRFDTPKGLLSVEDLWDLPLSSTVSGKANLDDIARALHKQLKNDDDVSFVNASKMSDQTVQLKFDLVKTIIETRMAENATKRNEAELAEKRQAIMRIIEEKQNENLRSASIEDLQKMLG